MPIHLKRTVNPETTILLEYDRLAQDLKNNPSSERLKIEVDKLKWVLEVFADYRETIEQNERARQPKP